MDIETAVWLVIAIGLFVGLVLGGFWVIARAGLGRVANAVFGVIVLIVIVFTLVYVAQHFNGGTITRTTVIR